MKLFSTCTQCGSDHDLYVAFSTHKICGDCTNNNYRKATYQRKAVKKYNGKI